MLSRAEHTEGDVELGERGKPEVVKAPEDAAQGILAEKAKKEFRTSLQKIFNNVIWVDNIMDDVEYWDYG